MQPALIRPLRLVWFICGFFMLIGMGSCHHSETVNVPYARSQLWAVAPPINESGVSIVQTDRVADLLTEEVQRVPGINAIPVNRVIAAMNQLNITAVHSVGDARALMGLLGLDGILVGTVTAYDPYRPPKLGMALELHVFTPHRRRYWGDPNDLVRSPTGEPSANANITPNPVAQVAGIFDAEHTETQQLLESYANHHPIPENAYGDDIYLVRMDLYTQFVCHQLINELLRTEQARIGAMTSAEPSR